MNTYKTLLIALLLFHLTSCGETKKASEEVSFTTIIDIANATKDGIYINNYIVEIDYDEAKKLNGKKVKISGKTTIIKGVENDGEIIKQGRSKDMKHIKSPKIEILSD